MTASRALEATRRPVVRVILAAGQRWVVRCDTCGVDVYAAAAKCDADDHARWHRGDHRRAWHAAEHASRARLARPEATP